MGWIVQLRVARMNWASGPLLVSIIIPCNDAKDVHGGSVWGLEFGNWVMIHWHSKWSIVVVVYEIEGISVVRSPADGCPILGSYGFLNFDYCGSVG